MTRLIAIAAIAAVAACSDNSGPAKDPPSRTETAKTKPKPASDAFCDERAPAHDARPLTWPALSAAVPSASSRPRWINVWASWCAPCVEEMPRLVRWQAKLAAAGKPFDLAFVSIDSNEDDLARFRAKHADAPATALRVTDPAGHEAWFKKLGLDGNAPIPVHIVVDGNDRVRCVRSAAVRDSDFAAVERLVREL